MNPCLLKGAAYAAETRLGCGQSDDADAGLSGRRLRERPHELRRRPGPADPPAHRRPHAPPRRHVRHGVDTYFRRGRFERPAPAFGGLAREGQNHYPAAVCPVAPG